jgi:hypothetical protein
MIPEFDERGNLPPGMTYLDYFQRDHKGQAKGVLAINLAGLP